MGGTALRNGGLGCIKEIGCNVVPKSEDYNKNSARFKVTVM